MQDDSRCLPKYLFGWFLTINPSAIANSGPLPSIYGVQLDELKMPVPHELREIVAIRDAIGRKVDPHRKKRGHGFKPLLHKLMTGKGGVADLDLSVLPLTIAI